MIENVGMVSLGCSKNRVDSEVLLGYLKSAGFKLVQDPKAADVIIVNTCGFINEAKQDSINTALEMAQYKETGRCKLLVMTGCLSQRYRNELRDEMPEVDIFAGVNEYERLAEELAKRAGKSLCARTGYGRVLTTPSFRAFLRIADGCDNRCTYCAIPLIRGGRRSVPMEKLIAEARELVSRGVKELTVIAQDTTGYGTDIYGKPMTAELLTELSKIDGIEMIYLLYTYPDTVTRELIDTIAANEKIANYIDMPIQHINDAVLKRMNRRGTREHIENTVKYIRAAHPGFILRSTAIVGFPGETEGQFEELMTFFRENPFDRLGAFAYSPEDNTPAAEFENQISGEVKQERLKRLYEQQMGISLALNKARLGKVERVVVEYTQGDTAYCRSYAEAPDTDGFIIVPSGGELREGDYTDVRLTRAMEYDIMGERV